MGRERAVTNTCSSGFLFFSLDIKKVRNQIDVYNRFKLGGIYTHNAVKCKDIWGRERDREKEHQMNICM